MAPKSPTPKLEGPKSLERFVEGKTAKRQGSMTAKSPMKATLYFPEDLHHRLKIRAAETKTSISELVVTWVEEGLKKGR